MCWSKKFDEGLAIPGPFIIGAVVIEPVIDQYPALLPAKITVEQAIKFSEALAK